MSRVSIADRGRLSWLVLRRGFNHLVGRAKAHPLAQLIPWLLVFGAVGLEQRALRRWAARRPAVVAVPLAEAR